MLQLVIARDKEYSYSGLELDRDYRATIVVLYGEHKMVSTFIGTIKNLAQNKT